MPSLNCYPRQNGHDTHEHTKLTKHIESFSCVS